MIDQASVPSLMGSTVRDSSGDKIGKIGQVYLDDTTGRPEWVTVRTGLFGTRESFVPLAAAHVDGDELVVDVAKDKVTDAPKIDEDGHLSEEQETELYAYYGVSQGDFGRSRSEREADPSTGFAAGQVAPADTDYDTTDRATGVAPTALGTDHDRTDAATGVAAGDQDGTAGPDERPLATSIPDTAPVTDPTAGAPAGDNRRLRRYLATDEDPDTARRES